MNRLLNKAPSTVTVSGVEYPINTDYRGCIFTLEQLQNPDFLPEEKIEILINNMYLEDPSDTQEAVERALWFLRCGEDYKESNRPNVCDFAQDSKYIYDAFLKANINLDDVDDGELHWWTFMSRFSELPECMFSRIIYLRSRKRDGKLTKDEKIECDRIGWEVIDIKERETAEEQLLSDKLKGWLQDN